MTRRTGTISIEVTMSFLLLMTLFFFVSQIFTTGAMASMKGRYRATAIRLARTLLERQRSRLLGSLQNDPLASGGWNQHPENQAYQYRVVIDRGSIPDPRKADPSFLNLREALAPVASDLRYITVTVRGPVDSNDNPVSQSVTVTLETLMAREASP